MSNLEKHAYEELRRAGMFDADSDYNGEIGRAVMELIRTLAAQRHSGGSHSVTMALFTQLANFKVLTSITSDPSEWMQVSDAVWQNRRQCSTFSVDGGKTWYDLDDPEKKNWPERLI